MNNQLIDQWAGFLQGIICVISSILGTSTGQCPNNHARSSCDVVKRGRANPRRPDTAAWLCVNPDNHFLPLGLTASHCPDGEARNQTVSLGPLLALHIYVSET